MEETIERTRRGWPVASAAGDRSGTGRGSVVKQRFRNGAHVSTIATAQNFIFTVLSQDGERTSSLNSESIFRCMITPIRQKLLLLVLVVGLAGVALGWWMIGGAPGDTFSESTFGEGSPPDRRVERTNEGRVLRVVDHTGSTVVRYPIDAFNEWTTAHWDTIFTDRPSFGEIRAVDFDDFRQFDRGAALSPQGDVLAFSVSDYAAAATLSFVGFLDVASGEVTLADDTNRGSIDTLRWSPRGRYVAYRLHTARSHGDRLSVDRATPPTKIISLTGADLFTALDDSASPTPSSFRPGFDDLTWRSRGRLSMTSRDPRGGRARWRLAVKEAELTRVD